MIRPNKMAALLFSVQRLPDLVLPHPYLKGVITFPS